METHGIHTGPGRKEITCSDCGHVYLISVGQSGGTCKVCGNVEFAGGKAGNVSSRGVTALSEEIVARRVLPRLREPGSGAPAVAADPLAAFRVTPDGAAVEALRTKYQVEWQLWARLVRHFEDPACHMAYLTLAIAAERLELAAERYREHRSVMAIVEESRWQAEVADLMLARIEAISIARMPNARGNYEFDVPEFLKLLPFDSRLYKVAWVALGLFFVAKLLHLSPIRP